MTAGWHTMKFTWIEVQPKKAAQYGEPDDSNYPISAIRERANIAMYIDDVEVLNEPNVQWTPANSLRSYIGCFVPDLATSLYQAGRQNILLDNILIPEPNYNDIIIQESPYSITSTNIISSLVYIPAGQKKAYLSVEQRSKKRATDPALDYEYSMKYSVYGNTVNSTRSVMNITDTRDLIVPNGDAVSWVITSGYWFAPYSDNFDSNQAAVNTALKDFPYELKADPYRLVFDVSNLIAPGRLNLIEVVGLGSNQREIRNFKLLTSFTEAPTPKDPNLRDTVVLTNPVVPKSNFDVSYTARLSSSGGGLQVTVDGDTYYIDSKFSYPNSAFRTLPGNSSYQNWTTINIAADGNSLSATTPTYSLNRALVKYSDHFEIEDTITNTSQNTIGIRLGHSVNISSNSLINTYAHGHKMPYKTELFEDTNWKNSWNPTIYLARLGSGLGLLVRDKVFRSHLSIQMKSGAYGIHDKYFALSAGDSYKLKWAAYPTANGSYYDFINAARDTIGSNYLIDGSAITCSSLYIGNMNKVSDDDIRNLVHCNGVKYATIATLYGINSDGNKVVDTTDNRNTLFGPAVIRETTDPNDYNSLYYTSYWNRYYIENTIIPRFRSLTPQAKLLVYLYPWCSSEANAVDLYPDDQFRNAVGTNVYHVAPVAGKNTGIASFITTMQSSFGEAMRAAYDYGSEKADGFYMDASSAWTRAYVSYDVNNWWDGYTCLMDLGTNANDWNEPGATYVYQQALTSSTLSTLDYRCHQRRKVRLKDCQTWCNFQPCTEEFLAEQGYHFVENRTTNNVCSAHLGTPCGLLAEYWGREPGDTGLASWYSISYGGLPIVHSVAARYTDDKDGTISQDIYPIKPLELYPGYVLGENKAITTVPGWFGFGDGAGSDANNLTVRVYDVNGFRVYPDPEYSIQYNATVGSTVAYVDIDTNKKEMAIVFRYKPETPTHFRPYNGQTNVSTAERLKWCPGIDANSQKLYFSTNQTYITTKNAAAYKGIIDIGASSIYDPAPLEPSTTYYWGVQTLDTNDTELTYVTGSFTTAAAQWSVDFEDGFTASSGTVLIQGGDINQPSGNYAEIYTLYDTNAASRVVKVGRTTHECYLNYSNLATSVLGSEGSVSLDFKIPENEITETTVFFNACPGATSSVPWWFIGMPAKNKPYIRSYSPLGGTGIAGAKNYYTTLASPLSTGWHTMLFKWKRVSAGGGGARERADLKMYIDSNLVINEPNVYWSEPSFSQLNIGHQWLGSTAIKSSHAGLMNVLLDDIVIKDYNETASRWSVSFDANFAASSGTVNILGGNVNNPDGNKNVYTCWDTDSSNTVVRVGNDSNDKSYLQYSNIDYATILAPQGSLTFDFEVNNSISSGYAVLFNASKGSGSAPYWWIGFANSTTPYIRSYSNIAPSGDTGSKNYSATLPSAISNGWHTLQFKWKRTVAYNAASTPKVRERADIELFIDGNSVINMDNVFWNEPDTRKIHVGCFWIEGLGLPSYECGEQNIYIDNIIIEDFNQTTSRWSVDFDDGFTASSGTVATSESDVNHPAYADVYIIHDSSGTNMVKVGQSGYPSYLNYSDLASSVLGDQGTISMDLYVAGNVSGTTALLSSCPEATASVPWWFIGIGKGAGTENIPYIRTNSSIGDINDTGVKNYYNTAYSISTGWHTLKFRWNRTEPVRSDADPEIRERANLQMWIDGTSVLDVNDVLWSEVRNTSINVGGMWLGSTANPNCEAGEQGILIDNITITP
ncbi:MAG: hypothetical protein LLF92_03430 [Planctomycetaceae bacterium]|nr:hypothetical protein [Planctomycetaceae bacterium]